MSRFIITTRPEEKTIPAISSRCFEIVNIPVTRLRVNSKFSIAEISEFNPDIAIFTSTYGSEIFLDAGGKAALGHETKIIAIGNRTADVLEKTFPDVIVPEEQTSKGVVNVLRGMVEGRKKVALFVSSKSNGIIDQYLSEAGINHITSELYFSDVLQRKDFIDASLKEECFGIILTSSYEAKVIFTKMLDKEQRDEVVSRCRIFAIGKTTAETLLELGIQVSKPSGKSNLEKLIREIDNTFCE